MNAVGYVEITRSAGPRPHERLNLAGYVLDSGGYGLAAFRGVGALDLRPASGSGTKASRAVQGDRPTWVIGVKIRTFSCHNVSIGVGFEAPKPARLGLILTPMRRRGRPPYLGIRLARE